jgi:hypothetical protein
VSFGGVSVTDRISVVVVIAIAIVWTVPPNPVIAVQDMSINNDEVQGNDTSRNASVSADRTIVAFESDSTNLVANDTNATQDVFVRGPSVAQ